MSPLLMWEQTFCVEDGLTVEGAMANAVVGSLSQACPFMVFSSPLLETVCLPTGLTPDHLPPHLSNVVWCVCYFYLHLTHLCSILSLLCHPTHLYLLSPHLIFCDSESAYSFHIYLPPCLLLGYGLCTQPALNMYVYKHLVSAVSIPQT